MIREWGLVGLFACLACGTDAVPGGGGTEGTTAASSSTTGPGPGEIPPCGNAVAIMQPGPGQADSGFFQCENGFIHRVFSLACDPGAWTQGDCQVDDAAAECSRDADCVGVGGVEGLCLSSAQPGAGCYCNFGCQQDSDCTPSEACYCDGIRSQCIPAACRTDSDCPTDQPCGLNERVAPCGIISRALTCATPLDECRIDSQCLECQQCLGWTDADHWYCTDNTGVCAPCD